MFYFCIFCSIVHQDEKKFIVRIGSLVIHNIGQLLPHQLQSGKFHNIHHLYPVSNTVHRHTLKQVPHHLCPGSKTIHQHTLHWSLLRNATNFFGRGFAVERWPSRKKGKYIGFKWSMTSYFWLWKEGDRQLRWPHEKRFRNRSISVNSVHGS